MAVILIVVAVRARWFGGEAEHNLFLNLELAPEAPDRAYIEMYRSQMSP